MAQAGVVNIIKRDGRIEEFQPSKIAGAIEKALMVPGQADGDVSILRGKLLAVSY